MKTTSLLIAVLLCHISSFGQYAFRGKILDKTSGQPLPGATFSFTDLKRSMAANDTGVVEFSGIPSGLHNIRISYTGYEILFIRANVTGEQDSLQLFLLSARNESEDNELNQVIITATRSGLDLASTPTRAEVVNGEELQEKANMKPGDIRMLLAETTGIQTQQTSATSANASIRIQGLDGKYTQIIRDGFPLYSGFSGGLGLLQIAPLDLKQVEVIKGSSSTLYGGGAIAGLVNLVSKTPSEKPQLNVLLNATSALGFDGSAFYSWRSENIGTTIFAAYNHGNAYDPANIDLTAIPKYDRVTLNPKVWLYLGKNTTINVGVNAMSENRIGGDLHYIKGDASSDHSYFEQNKTGRISTQAGFDTWLNYQSKLSVKNSLSYYDRKMQLPDYIFSGKQFSTFSEANYAYNGVKAEWIAGLNFYSDHFAEDKQISFPLRSYSQNTFGIFLQNTWRVTEKLSLESGLRGDYHTDYGFFVLPRLAGLWKINPYLSTRISGGLGYKPPTIFTEDAERIQFRNVLPIDVNNTKAERSYGANIDLNYTVRLVNDKVGFSVNQLFFYTRIKDPIILTSLDNGYLQYLQPQGDLHTKGLETNARIITGNFKLFIGYTFADVNQHTNDLFRQYPLVSKHRLNNVLMYELEDKWKIGLEAYYFSRQQLNDGTTGRSYWTTGFMAEKIWEKFSLFINFENFTDTRQTRFGSIYTGSITNPEFKDIYAPLDGFVINGGIKLNFD
ncbi:TonB-dependent receptor [Pedobacter sp. HMF7647]|uniref:TonB-dependent receptor n=1 Tax=Hufsiella arboris TaxID=2695275 RepID=A0A7K1YEF9_9SPHI|nr:TonB-dependent receptor [Hufsiella arboris]MXV52994.1 TonB-dependent receptor [Hufsiella arboris]